MKPLCPAVLLAACLLPTQAQTPQRLRAGAAKVGITPSASQLTIATDSIRDHIYIRAIFVDGGTSCAVLVAIDGGARNNVVDPAIAKSSASVNCPAENYIISGTHSHSASAGGPGGDGSAEQAEPPAVRIRHVSKVQRVW